jgi:hypothetical protein
MVEYFPAVENIFQTVRINGALLIKLNYCGRGGIHKKVGSDLKHSARGIEQKLRLEHEAQSQKRREIDGENG